jgi:hypothetical protein
MRRTQYPLQPGLLLLAGVIALSCGGAGLTAALAQRSTAGGPAAVTAAAPAPAVAAAPAPGQSATPQMAQNTATAPGGQKGKPAVWLDVAHWVGITGGVLALGAVAMGLLLFLFWRRTGSRERAQRKLLLRKIHFTLGLLAVVGAVTHVVMRYVQLGVLSFSPRGPFPLMVLFVLLGLSGIGRAWSPPLLRRHQVFWAWTHRLLVVLTLLALGRHIYFQIHLFLG